MNKDLVIQIVSEAIKTKTSVLLQYDKPGDPAKGTRIGYPHALYVHVSTKNILFDLYQIQGDSSKPLPLSGDWRDFDIKYIKHIELIKGKHFHVQKGYKTKSDRYRQAIIKIEEEEAV